MLILTRTIRVLLIALLVVAVPTAMHVWAFTGPALVAHTAAGSSDQTAVTTTGIDTTTANFIALIVCSSTDGSDVTPTDSKSNTWTGLTVRTSASSDRIRIWYATNPTTDAAQTFSSSSLTTYPSIMVLAFSGVATSTPFDVENGASTTGATSLATGSVTPSQSTSVVLAGNELAHAIAPTITSSHLVVEDDVANSGNHVGCHSAYYIQPGAAGAENTTWDFGGFSENSAAAIAVFKPAAGGAGVSMPCSLLLGVGCLPAHPQRHP